MQISLLLASYRTPGILILLTANGLNCGGVERSYVFLTESFSRNRFGFGSTLSLGHPLGPEVQGFQGVCPRQWRVLISSACGPDATREKNERWKREIERERKKEKWDMHDVYNNKPTSGANRGAVESERTIKRRKQARVERPRESI